MTARPTPLRDARDSLHAWLGGGGPWLTITGEPGVGKSHLARTALAEGLLPPGLLLLDPAPTVPPDLGPGVRVAAVGTRRDLHPAEQVIEVSPLDPTDAAALFVSVVRLVEPGLAPLLEAEVVAELVERVGGNPLAIGLLARACSVATPAELLARLDRPAEDRVDPLMHASQAPWSRLVVRLDEVWAALDPDSQALLSRCEVFAGSFSLDDVEAVLGVAGALAGLQTLRAHSMLSREGGRLAMSKVMRRYIRACRPASEDGRTRRHRARFASLARGAAEAVSRDVSGAISEIDAIEAELAAILATGDTPGVDGQDADACDAALALSLLANSRGGPASQRRFAERAVGPPGRGAGRLDRGGRGPRDAAPRRGGGAQRGSGAGG